MLGLRREVREYRRHAAELQSLGVQEMFGQADHFKAEILGHLRQFGYFLDHPLNAVVMMRDRAQPPALFEGAGNAGKKKAHELHRPITP